MQFAPALMQLHWLVVHWDDGQLQRVICKTISGAKSLPTGNMDGRNEFPFSPIQNHRRQVQVDSTDTVLPHDCHKMCPLDIQF